MLQRIALQHRMLLGGIAAVLIPFFIAGILIHMQLSSSLLDMTREQSLSIARDISGVVDATLMQETKLASAIAAVLDVSTASNTGDYRKVQVELETIYGRIGKTFFTVFFADAQGIIRADAHFGQQVGIDISDRDYFLKAKKGQTSVTGPLFAKGTATPGEAIIIVSAPIYLRNTFCGLVGIPFNTDFLVGIISQRTLGRTGLAYLINSEGLVLAHPRKEFTLALRLLDQPGTEDMRALVLGKKTGTVSYAFDGSERIAGLSPVPLTGWTVVFSQTREEVMSPVNRILSALFISGIIFLGITLAIITILSGKLSTPIRKIMEMMEQVTQHSTEIILQIGVDRRILFANPAYERLTGLTLDTIRGTTLSLTPSGNTPEHVIWSSLEAGTSWSGRVEVAGRLPDPIILDVMLVPMRDNAGLIQGYLEIGRDVTAELMYEKRLQQTQKLEAIGTLAGGVAHDFNNILCGIVGYAELSLLRRTYDSTTEEHLREILAASERARALVGQILTFSRQAEVPLKPLPPEPVVKEALKLLRASLPATINIRSTLNSRSIILAEPTQIYQIVMNLFTNAAHAIGEKVGTITVDLEDFFVDEDFARMHPGIGPGKHILLRVSDTGSGIDPNILDHVFEPFFTTRPHGKGTGLGLSVVHGIVKTLGGIITVYSESGKGTVFNVIIPSQETDDLQLRQAETLARKGTERIVFIDDESAIAKTMQSILASLGYRVTTFTKGTEALVAIRAHPEDFDVIITDYSMPQITGLDIARSVREAGVDIPVILTSGFLDKTVEDAARNAGISEMVTKPINSYQLTDAIHRVTKGV